MIIRPITFVDLPKIAPVFCAVFHEEPYKEPWEEKDALLRLKEILNQGQGFCFLAEEEKHCIGFLFAQKETWFDGIHLFIQDSGVLSQFRNKGIGSMLVEALLARAKAKGIKAIELSVWEASRAEQFWKNHGFQKTPYVILKKTLHEKKKKDY